MYNEPTKLEIPNRLHRGSRTPCGGASAGSISKLKIVDAAFGDLETINLCRVDSPATNDARNVGVSHGKLVQDLAGQLRSLDQRFQEISKLLKALQTPISDED